MRKYFAVLIIVSVFGVGCVSSRSTPNPEPIGKSAVPDYVTTSTTSAPASTSTALVPQTVSLANGKRFALNVPEGFRISVAAQGFKHLRFMAMSPDQRLFVGEMASANDTSKGHVYVFNFVDQSKGILGSAHAYLSNLRNPNSIAFYIEPSGKKWLYVALTDKLMRYEYTNGSDAPKGAPETIATFPDYGRPWTQGGWHLTRTVIVRNGKINVSVGSSCNSCEEKTNEPQRATILEMNPDGSNQKIIANGLRNAVGIGYLGDTLYATANEPDHLGSDRPQDLFYRIVQGTNYGWPYCYQLNGKILKDTSQSWTRAFDCSSVPLGMYAFDPHAAPLGFDVFGNTFLVALHGSGKKEIGNGYKIVALRTDGSGQSDFMTGFLDQGKVFGRPVDILTQDANAFFVTDDLNGVIYFVHK